MRTATVVLLLVVACFASAVCARPALGGMSMDVIEALKVWGNGRVDVEGSGFGGGEAEEENFRITLRLEVLPSVADDFEKLWLDLKGDLEKEKGLRRLEVTSDILNNRFFHVYEEWDNMESFISSMKKEGSACERVGTFIKKHDIGLCATQLLPVAVHRSRSQHNRGEGEDFAPRVLLKALIKPSVKDEFEEAVQVLIEKVAKAEEAGTLLFAWHKVAVDDTTYLGYAKWQDMESMRKFLSSEHRQEFLAGAIQRDIIMQKTYLQPIIEIDLEG